ncbi:MAG: WG repeat-containing protein [Bacteroidetes bacterium]|nr:WG repeat-containing protein [Bacteroidota bacterium]
MKKFFLAPLIITGVLLSSCSHNGKYMAYVKVKGKYGYINENGDMLIDAKYENAWSFIRGCAVVKENGKYGLINKEGNYIVKNEYDSMIPFSSSCIIIEKNKAFGFMENGTGKILITPQYEKVFYYTDNLCVVQKGKALGIVNNKGKLTCPVVMQDFKDMMGAAGKCIQNDTTDEMAMLLSLMQGGQDVKEGLINRNGEVIIQPKYDDIFDYDLSNGFYYPFLRNADSTSDTLPHLDDEPAVIPPGIYGIADTTGKIISEPAFEEIPVYGDGMFRVKQKGKYGYMDVKGKMIIEPKYDYAVAFNEGLAIVSVGSHSGKQIVLYQNTASIIDKTGKVLVEDLGPGSGLYRFNSGLARCRSMDGQYGFLDVTGKRVIPTTFDVADDFDRGRAIVSENDKYGLIDTKGNFIVQPQFEFFYDLGGGYYQTKNEDDLAGVVDSTGKVILQPVFTEVFHLQKNFFTVEKDELNGCYDLSGKEIFPPKSTRSVYFMKGTCIVDNDGIPSLIDSTGKNLVPPVYDSIGVFYNGYASVRLKGKFGLIDSTGKKIIDTKYSEIRPFVNGYAVFSDNGKYGYLDTKGAVVVEAKFEDAAVLVDPDRKEFE